MNPVRVLVTGAGGMVGWHVACFLRTVPGFEVLAVGREAFESPDSLEAAVRGCDAVIHCAGMNRGDEAVVARTNVRLVESLVAALEACSSRAHVVFTSSTHIERDSLYGASKRECAGLFAAWAARAGAKFSNLVLPNVFGEQGRPFYNSVVSTFCHQLAVGETPTVAQDAELEQVHAQQVARVMLACLRDAHSGDLRVAGHKVSVSGLLERLHGFQASYAGQVIPDLRQDFDRDLFNTFRSYLYPALYPVALKVHSDARGFLFESVKSLNGGQSFVSSTVPGITRGNHYHSRKVERFLVVSGRAEIRLRRVLDDAVQVFSVSGDQPAFVDIPTLHTHNITNTGSSELLTLFWTHELFDPENPDTFAELV